MIRIAALCLALAFAQGCSVRQYAMSRVGDALAGGGDVFAAEDDPELARAAAPFSLKLMESMLAEIPAHAGLLTAAASGFAQYSYAFVQQDADEAEARDVLAAAALRERARRLYIRARDYALRALEARHPGFAAELERDPKRALARLSRAAVLALYWLTVASAAVVSLSKDSAHAIAELPRIDQLVQQLQAIDPEFGEGALQAFLISYEMARPGSRDADARARQHFEHAVRLSQRQKAAPFVALAESLCVREQKKDEFTALLGEAIALEPARRPEWRLENLVMQRRARWLLSQTEHLFID
jgi:predicted anti-sigma-YlaC factor YlaD